MRRDVRVMTRAGLERVLLVECPELAVDDERGCQLRRFANVVRSLVGVCPWIDPVRPGVCTLPIKGPARYFGGERAVLAVVEAAVVSAGCHAGTDAPSAGEEPFPVRLGVAEGVFAAALAARVG